jgi:nitrous oxide reductase accessory protein NosL
MIQTVFVLGMITLASCDRGAATGPPTLRLGRDECSECGMAIHEERSAAALLVDREGRREYLLFDDIGCMLDIEQSKGTQFRVIDRFVHDHSSNAWISAGAAVFLATDGSALRTPMASGMAAFANHASAESGLRQFGGGVHDYSSLAARRRVQMEERRQSAGG